MPPTFSPFSEHETDICNFCQAFCCGNNANGQCGVGSDWTQLFAATRMRLPGDQRAALGACGAIHSVVVCNHVDSPNVSTVFSCGSGGCWQLGACWCECVCECECGCGCT